MAMFVLPALFFPHSDPLVGVAVMVSASVGTVLARPLGALLSGWIGRRAGMPAALRLSLLTMGWCGVMIGVLPTYDVIGVAAPWLLVALRCVQELAHGGGWAPAVLWPVRDARGLPRGLPMALAQAGPALGIVLGVVVLAGVMFGLAPGALAQFGWRWPFLGSVLLVIVGARVGEATPLRDTPASVPMFGSGERAAASPREVDAAGSKLPWATWAEAGAMRIGPSALAAALVGAGWVGTVRSGFAPVPVGGAMLLLAAALHGGLVLGFGAVSARLGRAPLFIGGAVGGALAVGVASAALTTACPGLLCAALAFGVSAHAAMFAVQPAMMAARFTPRARLAGVAGAYAISEALTRGVASALLARLAGHALGPLAMGFVAGGVTMALGVSVLAGWRGLLAPRAHPADGPCRVGSPEARGEGQVRGGYLPKNQ